jgi:hypothetical protein
VEQYEYLTFNQNRLWVLEFFYLYKWIDEKTEHRDAMWTSKSFGMNKWGKRNEYNFGSSRSKGE